MKPQEYFASIKSGALRQVYLLAGDEQYLLARAAEALERRLAVDALNREVFSVPDATAPSIVAAAQTMPFLHEWRLVIVKEAHRLKSAESAPLTAYCTAPSTTTVLLLLWPEKLRPENRRHPLVAAVDKQGGLVEFRALYDSELPGWVQQEAARIGKKMSADAAELLVRESGSSLLDLANEVEKLALYTAGSDRITPADVETCSGHTRQANLNQLFTAVEERDARETVRLVEALVAEGEIPLRILATIQRAVRRILIAKSMAAEQKQSPADISRALRLHQYFDRAFFGRINRYTRESLEYGLHLILQADHELKTGGRPDSMILTDLVLALCGQRSHQF